jgi:hypothetical protein
MVDRVASTLLSRRYAEPSEIAVAVVYQALADANFVHGVTLPVNGGYLAISPIGIPSGPLSALDRAQKERRLAHCGYIQGSRSVE